MPKKRTRKLERTMAEAQSYDEWHQAAVLHDEITGKMRWRQVDQSSLYDYPSIRLRLERLRELRARKDYPGLLFTLNEGIHGNLGGMGNSLLYQRAYSGTKLLISSYVDEISDTLDLLAEVDDKVISREEKIDFFRRAHHCFGQSALMLSGSGMLLYFHLGVVKALWQENLLPNVMSGSSGGSFVGCLLATHSDDEMPPLFDPEYLVHERNEAIQKNSVIGKLRPEMLTVDDIREIFERLLPDMTFQESYQKTGRRMNVSIAPAELHQTSRLLNATTSPNVLIREAVLASGAVPGIYPPVTLMARDKHGEKQPYLPSRKWIDGAVSDDLPAKRLARLYGVNHYIVSQTNPHIIPFIGDSKRSTSTTSTLKVATTRTTREWLNAGYSIFRKPLSRFPKVNQLTNTALAMINQDYIGDVNILPPRRWHKPSRLLAHLSLEEITNLVDMGERATWPKMEMIRIQTKIGRTLERIRDENDPIVISTDQPV